MRKNILVCDYCGVIITDKFIQKYSNTKSFEFCSEICLNEYLNKNDLDLKDEVLPLNSGSSQYDL